MEQELHVDLRQCLSVRSDVKFMSLAVLILAIALAVVLEVGFRSHHLTLLVMWRV